MDLTFDVLLFLHLTAFAVGVTANIALPVVMSQMPRLGVEAGPAVGAIAQRLVTYGRAGFATLIVTGVAMVYLRFGGFANLGPWFTLKDGVGCPHRCAYGRRRVRAAGQDQSTPFRTCLATDAAGDRVRGGGCVQLNASCAAAKRQTTRRISGGATSG